MRAGIIVIVDAIVVSVAWIGAYFTRSALNDVFGYPINEFSPYLKGLPIMVFAWLITSYSLGIYRKEKRTPTEELRKVLNLAVLGALVSMALAFYFREFWFGRSVVGLFAIYSFILLSISRLLLVKEKRERVAILGTGPLAIRFLQKLQDNPEPFEVVGFIGEEVQEGYKLLGHSDEISKIVREHKLDEIIIAKEMKIDEIMELVTENENMKFRIIGKGFEALSSSMDVEFVGDLPVVEFGLGRPSPVYNIAKRIFDVILTIAVIIITLPIWIVTAILIKLDSKGPIFFVQERIGYKGKLFKIIKFRTMYTKAPKYALSPRNLDDPRVTKVGRFLRRWSIDELPQVLNILKGDMSFVGPRPEMPQIVKQYKPWQRRRLDVKPGLTGIWQILGRKELPLESNIHYDFIYLKNRSFFLDLALIIKTIPVLLKRKGSY